VFFIVLVATAKLLRAMSTGASFVTALPVCVKVSAEIRAESAYNLALSKKRKLTVCCGSFYILIKLKEGLNG